MREICIKELCLNELCNVEYKNNNFASLGIIIIMVLLKLYAKSKTWPGALDSTWQLSELQKDCTAFSY